MRLGIVGLLPSDFREITVAHLHALQQLGLTGASFHGGGDLLNRVSVAECERVQATYAEAGIDLVQFGIGFSECLFSPDATIREQVVGKVTRGIEVAKQLGAHCCLIRTGSLSPRGSYSPNRKNHSAASWERLVTTMRQIAEQAEAVGQTIVIETHVLTILNSPEANVALVDEVGSDRIRIVMDYVNHFQTLMQVYNSGERLDQIFDVMGDICPVGHCKDITVNDGFVVHFSEEVPGEGELDLATALRRWHTLRPDGYMLLEHLSAPEPKTADDHPPQDHIGHTLGWSPRTIATYELYAKAARNVQRIAAEAGVPIV